MENKRCTKCGEVKDLSEFYKRENTKDGFYGHCKACKKTYNAKWVKENPEKVKVNNAKWQKENPEKHGVNVKRWNKKNPEKMRASHAKWAKENPEKVMTNNIRIELKKQIGATPPPELVEIKVLIHKTKKLCKTLKN